MLGLNEFILNSVKNHFKENIFMKFIDKLKIYIKAGDGGKGCTSFFRASCLPKGGPDGGHGGKGGSVLFMPDKNLNSLNHLSRAQKFIAENGAPGQGSQKSGKKGQDIIIRLPLGTKVYLEDQKVLLYDANRHNNTFVAAQGGRGGAGNSAFKSSINRTPTHSTPGQTGEELNVVLDLKLNSDIAIIGMPNAGKSTLLGSLTYSRTKIAPYPFATINPIISSVFYDNVEYKVADIPGLIKGAADGKGLGMQTLKHLENAKVLIHLLDSCSSSSKEDFYIIRNEMKKYCKSLTKKPYVVAMTKCDLETPDNLNTKKQILENSVKQGIFIISTQNIDSMHSLMVYAINLVKNIEN